MADEPEEPQNPFKGTPFEQFFTQGMAGMSGPGGQGMPDLNQLFGQLQSMMQPYDGPLNWDVALDLARSAANPRRIRLIFSSSHGCNSSSSRRVPDRKISIAG